MQNPDGWSGCRAWQCRACLRDDRATGSPLTSTVFDMECSVAYNDARMRLGLLADTHIPQVSAVLPPEVIKALQGVDLILHAGDIYTTSVLDDLECVAPVLAARGDDDFGDTLSDGRVKEKHILELEGQTLWLIHGRPDYGMDRYGLSSWWQSLLSPRQNRKPDIVVFGHQHRTVVERVDDVLFISPGSPTFLDYRRRLGTIGILDIEANKADFRIVQL